MLYRWLDGHKRLFITPEDTLDLWTIRRIISKGDQLEAWTTREVKIEGDYVRPDKGRRVKVRVNISVDDVRFDSELGRLRVKGVILDSNNEMVKRGAFHSIDITPSTEFSIWKDSFPHWVTEALRRRGESAPAVIVALDTREAGVGVLVGLSLQYTGTVRSEASGKMYPQDSSKLLQQYLAHVVDLVTDVRKRFPNSSVVLLGPGKTKLQLFNTLKEKGDVNIIEGFDLAGEDGVRLALNDQKFKQLRQGTLYNEVRTWIEEAQSRLARNDARLAMGYAACKEAAQAGAVDVLLISDGLFKSTSEAGIVELANNAESSGARVVLLDSTTVLGIQVSSMGGAIALLRYDPFRG